MQGLSSLSPDTTSQLNILRHDSHTLGVNSAQVSILKQSNKISLGSLLQSQHRRALKPKIGLEILGNLPHQSLERQLSDQQLGWLLVLADLTKGDSSRPVTMRLLHSTSSGSWFPCRLRCQLLTGSFSSRRLTRCLLCSRHCATLKTQPNRQLKPRRKIDPTRVRNRKKHRRVAETQQGSLERLLWEEREERRAKKRFGSDRT